MEVEHFDWIVFLPLQDEFGSYDRYYGRLSDTSIKVRGIAARRHDTPEFIRSMQGSMLALMAGAAGRGELEDLREEVRQLYLDAVQRLPDADVKDLVINRRIRRLTYSHRCLEATAVEACRRSGIEIAPGMTIGYVVRDARTYAVDTGWDAKHFDLLYYRTLLEKAWAEISYAFRCGVSHNAGTTVK